MKGLDAAVRTPAEPDAPEAFQNGAHQWVSRGGVFRTINRKPIFWQDKQGFVHAVEGADVHPGIRLLWTLCERDVPADKAFIGHEAVTCATCTARARAAAKDTP